MEAKLLAKQRGMESCQLRYDKLAEQYEGLLQDNEDITGKLEADEDLGAGWVANFFTMACIILYLKCLNIARPRIRSNCG